MARAARASRRSRPMRHAHLSEHLDGRLDGRIADELGSQPARCVRGRRECDRPPSFAASRTASSVGPVPCSSPGIAPQIWTDGRPERARLELVDDAPRASPPRDADDVCRAPADRGATVRRLRARSSSGTTSASSSPCTRSSSRASSSSTGIGLADLEADDAGGARLVEQTGDLEARRRRGARRSAAASAPAGSRAWPRARARRFAHRSV